MPDLFLSYCREDQTIARRFAEGFERAGLSVWWDQSLNPGEAFDQVTEQALEQARAVIVLWSKASVNSRWVRAEATQANAAGRLLPVMVEACKRPIMFELTHTAELSEWRGNAEDVAWQSFVASVRRFVQRGSSADTTGMPAMLVPPVRPPALQQRIAVALPALRASARRLGMLLRRFGGRLGFGLACAALAAFITWRAHPEPTPQIFASHIDLQNTANIPHGLAISPDGQRIAYASDSNQLYLYRLDTDTQTRIADGTNPFFSPDSRSLIYDDQFDNKLKASDFTAARELTSLDMANRATFTSGVWDQDMIYYGYADGRGLFRVAEAGGVAESFVKPAGQYQKVQYPEALPGGWILYAATGGSWNEADILARNVAGGESRLVLRNASSPRYLPSGHLLFVRGGVLYAVAFDAKRLKARSHEVSMQKILVDPTYGYAAYAVSDSGTLVYAPDTGSGIDPGTSLVRVGRDGKVTSLWQDLHDYGGVRASPGGSQVAVEVTGNDKQTHIWILDVKKGTLRQRTFDSDEDRYPVWTDDGQEVLYTSKRGAEYAIYRMRADGVGQPRRVVSGKSWNLAPSDVYSKTLIYQDDGEAGGRDILAIDLERDAGSSRPVLTTSADEFDGKVSPDGKWLVYVERTMSGDHYQVYARPYPDANGGSRYPIAEDAAEPHWSKLNGIYFLGGLPAKLFLGLVPVEAVATLDPGRSDTLFPVSARFRAQDINGYAQTYDLLSGGGFVMVMNGPVVPQEQSADRPPPRLNVVVGWMEGLKQRVSVK